MTVNGVSPDRPLRQDAMQVLMEEPTFSNSVQYLFRTESIYLPYLSGKHLYENLHGIETWLLGGSIMIRKIKTS